MTTAAVERETVPGIRGLDVGKLELGDRAFAVCDALQPLVVRSDDDPIACDLRVGLQVAIPQGDRSLERRERVLRSLAGASTVCESDRSRAIEEWVWTHQAWGHEGSKIRSSRTLA